MNDINNRFADRLKMLRLEKGLTGSELGAKIKMSKSGISSWEARNRQPSQDVLIQIADFFDVSVDYMLGVSDIRVIKEIIPEDSVNSFTVKLVEQLLRDKVISDPNDIDQNIIDMLVASLKSDLKKRT